MDPFNFRILQKFDLPNGTQGNQSLFRSTGSPNILIQGKGVWVIDPGELPIPLEQGDQGQFLNDGPRNACWWWLARRATSIPNSALRFSNKSWNNHHRPSNPNDHAGKTGFL